MLWSDIFIYLPTFLSLFLKLLYLFMCMSVLLTCMSVQHVHAVPAEYRRVLEPLKIELKTVVNCHVGAGN